MINKYKKIVIKIGSSSIVNPKSKKINTKWMIKLCKDIKKYHKEKNIIIVCSGAIALGSPLIKNKNLRKLEDKQAAASVGQIELAHQWKQHLKTHKIDIAQVLITLEDSEVRRRYLNARKTINTLLQNKVIPVINENDTVATEEIKYGDNDRLAARVAQIIGADSLIILSDVDGLYDKSKNKKIIKTVSKIDSNINAFIDNKKNSYGSGGISTKLDAAKICINAGCHMFIGNGKKNNPINNMIKNKIYTHFIPKISSLDARKKWIISSLNSSGKIYIDQGAARALNEGKSLLPAGIIKVEGSFEKGENILIVDENERSLARGLSSFTSSEINKIKGKQSKEIENILGYLSKSEIVHKDDMVKL